MGKGFMLADIDAAFRRYVPNPDLHTAISFSSSAPSSAASETSDTEMDAQTEKDLLKLMQQLMAQPKPP